MKLVDFDYSLPPELIARYPAKNRGDSRLLYVNRDSSLQHLHFSELIRLLKPHDLLVFNDSRVIPARLLGHKKTGGKVEILIERLLTTYQALAHVNANRSMRCGDNVFLEDGQSEIELVAKNNNLWQIKCHTPLLRVLKTIGHIPLPPYLGRHDKPVDKIRYQTVYAAKEGSVAAPTAGLHFTTAMLATINARGINTAFITLHVGAGTFEPVRVEDISQHRLHAEWFEISPSVCDKIATAKAKGGRVIAVGTTTLRCLEASGAKPYRGETAIFIYGDYPFRSVDGLITNFHLPKSSLLMLVCAFGGYKRVMTAYSEAILQQYRFYSYGDAMFLMR